MVRQVIEGTVLLIIVFYIATHARDFSQVIGAIGSTYIGGVKALQGR